MDASDLRFPDNSFDTVAAMYVITVVPDPEKVMRELARVTKPGGEVMLVNHFSQDEGVRGWVERQMAPFADLVGWHSVFDVSRVMVCPDLKLMERRSLQAVGHFHDDALPQGRRVRRASGGGGVGAKPDRQLIDVTPRRRPSTTSITCFVAHLRECRMVGCRGVLGAS